MEKKCVVVGVVLSLCAACRSSSNDDPASDDPLGVIRQASHGPVSNVMVRLLDTPSRDTVVCDGRVRGLAPTLTQTYQSTVTISYPTAGSVQRTGSVSLADPLDVNNADGQFMVELVESPPGS